MKNVEAVADQIKKLRTRTGVTNIFLMGKKLNEFIASDDVTVARNDSLVLLKKKTPHCTRIYFFARNEDALADMASLITEDDILPIMVDLVGKDDNPQRWCGILADNGFSHYITYGRWQGKTDKENADTLTVPEGIWDPVRLAQPEDADRIHALLEQSFDPLAYEYPDKEILAQRIENNEVYVTGVGGKIMTAFIGIIPNPRNCIMDYIVTDKTMRGKGGYNCVCNYVMTQLEHPAAFSYYASVENPVTGREKGLFGTRKDNFTKILMRYDN